jgi:hypothetical protein
MLVPSALMNTTCVFMKVTNFLLVLLFYLNVILQISLHFRLLILLIIHTWKLHPSSIQLATPPIPHLLGCEVYTDTYHNLPYIGQFVSGTQLASSLLLHGHYNSSVWIPSINSKEFITAQAHIASQYTDLAGS